MHLHLLLTGRCNLDCAYCFQTQRRVRARMTREMAMAAVEAVLDAGDPPHSLVLSGGEPFLAGTLLRQVVVQLRSRPAEPRLVECAVLTNGSLITDSDIDFLARHDVSLQVSFDGLESAQGWRAPGTHATILRRLERAVERRSGWTRGHLSVAMTVHGANVGRLAGSVEQLMAAGISDIQLGPLLTHDPTWSRAVRRRFAEQVDQVATKSTHHWKRTAEVPVRFLNPDRRTRRPPGGRPPGALCAVASPESVTVDPDGRAWSCPAFVASVQRLGAHGVFRRLDLGSVIAPDFYRRLRRLPRCAGRIPLLRDKERKTSPRGRCPDCPFFKQCGVCPASTLHIPSNRDPHRIPAHQCDFQFVTLRARSLFLSQIEVPFAPPFFSQAPLGPRQRPQQLESLNHFDVG